MDSNDGRAGIDAELVRRLVAAQFPQWAHLSITPVELDGWDNRTYRLGHDMTVRLPTAEGYAPAIEKEDRWLPILAPLLPVSIPTPLATGHPDEGYPLRWSIRRWIDGSIATHESVGDLLAFADPIAEFILALQSITATNGPRAGAHSFYRGTSPAYYDPETRRALDVLAGTVDVGRAAATWETALAAKRTGHPTWFHGDIASGNLLVQEGKLAAVIDFGTSGVGDPACDLVIAWTFFSGASRERFRASVNQDEATWARARGWALWKALISLVGEVADAEAAVVNRRIIDDVLNDAEAAL